MKQPVILIFDIGKTNKKWFLFSLDGQVVQSEQITLQETEDEDGFACENLPVLLEWMESCVQRLRQTQGLSIQAMNVASYGASLVHVRADGSPLPLENYLRPYPAALQAKFIDEHFGGHETMFMQQTASPLMGSLNAGLQLYRLKHEKPARYAQIKQSFHLPQYLAHKLGAAASSDFTSLGCHTGLWNFEQGQYHSWALAEGFDGLLAPLQTANYTRLQNDVVIGQGLHDSSSALIPYLAGSTEPFVLISTGTWCIGLNPFAHEPLTQNELSHDCLLFLQANGKPVKASRLFAGKEHAHQLGRIARHFQLPESFAYSLQQSVSPPPAAAPYLPSSWLYQHCAPAEETLWNLEGYENAQQAYTALALGLCGHLAISTGRVLQPHTKTIYVDGGFAANPLFIEALKAHFPAQKIEVKGFPQATATGAFLAVRPYVANG